ncbi:MAG: hypothetical protein ACE14M_16605 [Terriglobales bacterium]
MDGADDGDVQPAASHLDRRRCSVSSAGDLHTLLSLAALAEHGQLCSEKAAQVRFSEGPGQQPEHFGAPPGVDVYSSAGTLTGKPN